MSICAWNAAAVPYVCPAKRHLVVYNQLGKQMIKK